MKNLIYQYWDGQIRPGVKASVANIKEYAKRIGAEHLAELNPNYFKRLGSHSVYYGAFKPIFAKEFLKYDNVLFLDADIHAVDGLTENIFEQLDGEHMGICEEPFQPKQRTISLGQITNKKDEKWCQILKNRWGIDFPRTEEGLPKVYNSGVVLYSNEGLRFCKKNFVNFDAYIQEIRQHNMLKFYELDQNYLNAMMVISGMNYKVMDDAWNSCIHYTHDLMRPTKRINDMRKPDTKFVHVQMAGADKKDKDTLHRIVNLPQSDWNL